MTKKAVIPADIYDALELSALVFNGIGAGVSADLSPAALDAQGNGIPVCVVGHLEHADDDSVESWKSIENAAGYSPWSLPFINDYAVRAINTRKGKSGVDLNQRVSWEEYVAEMGWVRGPHPTTAEG